MLSDKEFKSYRDRVAKVLGDCPCDEQWPNECCAACIRLTEKLMAEEAMREPTVKWGKA